MEIVVVRYVSHGYRFEVPCFKPRLEKYYNELAAVPPATDAAAAPESKKQKKGKSNARSPQTPSFLDVVVVPQVFNNCHKREISLCSHLQKAFATSDALTIIPIILQQGQLVVTDKVRREKKATMHSYTQHVQETVRSLVINRFTGVEPEPHELNDAIAKETRVALASGGLYPLPMKLVSEEVVTDKSNASGGDLPSDELTELTWLHAFHVASALARGESDLKMPALVVMVTFRPSDAFAANPSVETERGGTHRSSAPSSRNASKTTSPALGAKREDKKTDLTMQDAWISVFMDFDGAVLCRKRSETKNVVFSTASSNGSPASTQSQANSRDVEGDRIIALGLIIHASLLQKQRPSTTDASADDHHATPSTAQDANGETLLSSGDGWSATEKAGSRWKEVMDQSVIVGVRPASDAECALFNKYEPVPPALFTEQGVSDFQLGESTVHAERDAKHQQHDVATNSKAEEAADASHPPGSSSSSSSSAHGNGGQREERSSAKHAPSHNQDAGDDGDDGFSDDDDGGRRRKKLKPKKKDEQKRALESSAYNAKTHKELQDLCKSHKLSTGGKKLDLVRRLVVHDLSNPS